MNKTFGLAVIALLGGSLAAEAQTLKIATEGAYPPFNMVNADGALVGFDVEIADALCAAMDRECEIVAQDWDGIIPGLVQGKYDAIVASMSITEERLEQIDFTDPYYSNYLGLVAATSSEADPGALDKETLGAQRATVAAQWAEDNFGRRADIKLYDTQTAAYADLESGRIEVLVSDYLPAADWLKDNSDYAFLGEKIDIDDQIGIGVRKEDTDLKEALNDALATILEDGTYATINDKYFSVNIY